MALHLNLLHEEIFEQRQRQRDPLKIGMMVLGAVGALMLVYYLWNAYKVLEIRNRLSQTEHDWSKVEPKVTAAQKRAAIESAAVRIGKGRRERGAAGLALSSLDQHRCLLQLG